MELAEARPLWDPQPGWLNTASYGLPPKPAWDSGSGRWRPGGTEATAGSRGASRAKGPGPRSPGWCTSTPQRSRSAEPSPSCSASLPRRSPTGRVSSSRRSSSPRTCSRGWCTRTAASRWSPCRRTGCWPPSTPGTTVVAVSLVQSSTGEVAPLDDLVAAARAVDALVVVDGSQAVGWLPTERARSTPSPARRTSG